MKKLIISLIAISFISLHAQFGADFLQLKGSARIQGMGNAAAGLDKTVDALLYNPAGLAGMDSLAIALSYKNQVFGNHYSEILLANNFGFGRLGIAFSMLTIPLGKTTEFGVIGDKANHFNFSLGICYQRDFDFFSLGVMPKFIQEDLGVESSPSVAFDVGFLFRIRPSSWQNKLNIGLYGRNMGLGMKFAGERENLAMLFGGGAYYIPFKGMAIAVDSTYSLNKVVAVNAGIEFVPFWMLIPRVGYEILINNDGNKMSLGFGLSFQKEFGSTTIGVDYGGAFDFDGNLGLGNHSASIKFSRPAIWTAKKASSSLVWDGTNSINIAVGDFTAKQTEPELALSAADFLRNDLSQYKAFAVVRRDKMQEILDEQAMQMSGITSGEDAAKLGMILNVSKFAYGDISRIGSEFYITVNIVDVESSRIDTSVEEVAGSQAEIRRTIERIAYKLDPSGGEAITIGGQYDEGATDTSAVTAENDATPAEDVPATVDDVVVDEGPQRAKYPPAFTETDPEYADFQATISIVKDLYKKKIYFESMKNLIKALNMSPYNKQCRGYLPKIYVRLTPEEKKKVRVLMVKIVKKYKVPDPEKSQGYRELYYMIKDK